MLYKLQFKALRFAYFLGMLTLLCQCKSSNLTKAQKQIADMSMLNSLMEQNAYYIDIEAVYPFATAATQRVLNSLFLSRTGNNASRIDVGGEGYFVNVRNDSVKGNLSFFGERRLSGGPYGGQNGGIEFNAIPKDYEKTINEKKKFLEVKFTVSEKEEATETYDVRLQIFPNHTVNVSITSTYKTFMNYKGNLNPDSNLTTLD